MNRSTPLSVCLALSLLACSERPSGPAAAADAGAPPTAQAGAEARDAGAPAGGDAVPDAGALAGQPATPDAGSATCSASTLTRSPTPMPPPPPPVEGMRRRIIAAAVACDYAALGALADQNGKGLRFSFGDAKDPVAFWREAEAAGEPALARMVQVLNLPYAKQGELFLWPAVHVTNAEKDWKAVTGVYPEEQVKAMREGGTGYLGLRLGITAKGDWQLSVAGD